MSNAHVSVVHSFAYISQEVKNKKAAIYIPSHMKYSKRRNQEEIVNLNMNLNTHVSLIPSRRSLPRQLTAYSNSSR